MRQAESSNMEEVCVTTTVTFEKVPVAVRK